MISDISNSFITIQGWMVSKLGLKGTELLLFALIFSFSQDGESTFKGSISYMTKWTGCSYRSVWDSLSSLIDKGYISKDSFVSKNGSRCEYWVNSSCIPFSLEGSL